MLPELFYLVNFTCSILFCVIGLIFSLLIVIIIVKTGRFRTFDNLLICNSSMSVVFYSIITLIGSISSLEKDWIINERYCVFRAYFYNVGIAAICYSKSMHAISRFFFAILYKHRYLLTMRTHQILIILTWIISLVICIPPFFVENGYGLEIESRSCVISSKMFILALYITFVSCLIPFQIIIYIYLYILCYVYRSTRRIHAFHQNINHLRKTNREMKLMKQMLIQTSILLTGGPLFLFLVLWHATQSQSPPQYLYLLAFNLMTIVATIVPLIQFFMHKQIRQSSLQLFRTYRQQRLWNIT